MISYISATYLCPVTSPAIKNGVLAIDKQSTIVGIYTEQEAKDEQIKDVKHYEGMLVPGFVNTHCHLELSILKGQIPKKTGLPAFVKSVMKLRTSDEYELYLAMSEADNDMYDNGIVAVGDVSNQLVSRSLKEKSLIYYFTFLEIMGFDPALAKAAMIRAKQLKGDLEPLPVSIVPHAPYSVSADLFAEINKYADYQGGSISIHNQETADENAFFEQKTGGFLDLFAFLGQDVSSYKPSGKSSLQTYLPLLSPELKTLLVHNTYTSAEDVAFAKSIHPNLYWCLCPNANLYIENKLPDVDMMRKADLKITLGTDSLASNDSLSILSEMNLLQDRFNVPTEELLTWATINGAEFLGIEDNFGSFELGKEPGVNLIDFRAVGTELRLGKQLRRLH